MDCWAASDLTKLCQVCLGEGEIDMLKHVINLPPEDENEDSQNTFHGNVSAQEMLSVFSNRQFTDLEHSVAANQLICHICLDELIACFLFSRKVEKADKKLAAYWANAVIDSDLAINEHATVEYLAEQPEEGVENYLFTTENAETGTEIAELINSEDNYEDESNGLLTAVVHQDGNLEPNQNAEVQQTAAAVLGQKRRKMTKNPTFVLTGGVSQILAHVNCSNTTASDEQNIMLATAIDTPTRQKRCKIRERQKSKLEQGSFVITQFIPSSVQMKTLQHNQAEGDDSIQAADNPMAGNELRTMDYAAVEIEAHGNNFNIYENDSITTAIKTATTVNSSNDHTASAVYVCKYCPQAFSAANFLITHVRKQHVCKYCTQAFTKSMELYEHIRSSHTDHKCAICSKELSTHSNLRSHIKRVHGVKLPAQVALLDYRPLTPAQNINHKNIPIKKTNFEEIQGLDCIEVQSFVEEVTDNMISS